jgi:hypothetical protein
MRKPMRTLSSTMRKSAAGNNIIGGPLDVDSQKAFLLAGKTRIIEAGTLFIFHAGKRGSNPRVGGSKLRPSEPPLGNNDLFD